jgi:hypothetical protein
MFLASCLVYSIIVTVLTGVIVLVVTRDPAQIVLFLAYGLLIEAGLAFVVGGAVANFSPAIGKIGESVVHSTPWGARRIKEAEKQGRIWIVTGAFLLLFGLLISTL